MEDLRTISEDLPLPLDTDGDVGGLLAMTLFFDSHAPLTQYYTINANLAIKIQTFNFPT